MDTKDEKAVGEKLVAAAMLNADGPAAEGISADFVKIRARIDRVVQSPISAGEPPKGPIHTADYTVKLPDMAGAARADQPTEGENPLLRQAAKYEAPYAAVPRVVGDAE
ncbi:MAG: hypothetical protein K6G29_05595 [Clostridiales bacterium]|nr:hypothetical protein [Clostridiales bacterium]